MTVNASSISKQYFDYVWYADKYPDLKAVYGYDKELLYSHYKTVGISEGRVARLDKDSLIHAHNFDYKRYAEDYPDVVNVVGSGANELWNHYQTSGKQEGRKAFATSPYMNSLIKVCDIAGTITTDSMSERDKVKAVHDWICTNIEYDHDNYLNGTIPVSSYRTHGAITTGKAVCQGYAELFEDFMDALGIDCIIVSGRADNGKVVDGHAWNQVKVDGKWYNIDVTWDDPVTSRGGQLTRYDYFLIGNAQISKDHFTSQDIHDC